MLNDKRYRIPTKTTPENQMLFIVNGLEQKVKRYEEALIEIRKQLIGGTYNTRIGKAMDIAQQALSQKSKRTWLPKKGEERVSGQELKRQEEVTVDDLIDIISKHCFILNSYQRQELATAIHKRITGGGK